MTGLEPGAGTALKPYHGARRGLSGGAAVTTQDMADSQKTAEHATEPIIMMETAPEGTHRGAALASYGCRVRQRSGDAPPMVVTAPGWSLAQAQLVVVGRQRSGACTAGMVG